MRHLDEPPSPARRALTLYTDTLSKSEELRAFTYMLPWSCCSVYEWAIAEPLWFEAVVWKSLRLCFLTSSCYDGLQIYEQKSMFWGWLIKYLNTSSVSTQVHCFYYKSWMWNFLIGIHHCGWYAHEMSGSTAIFEGSISFPWVTHLRGSGNSTN